MSILLKNCIIIFLCIYNVFNINIKMIAPNSSALYKENTTTPEALYPAKNSNNGKWGYVSKTGQWKIIAQFDGASTFNDGTAIVIIGGKKSLINERGKITFSPQKKSLQGPNIQYSIFSEGVIGADNGQLSGFVDMHGNWVIPPIYEGVRHFHEGMAVAKKDYKFGFIDKKGIWIISPIYEEIEEFSEGLSHVTLNGKSGYIDKTGKLVIGLKFDEAQSFSNGLAAASTEGSWGLINQSGDWVVPPSFDNILTGRYGDLYSEGISANKAGNYGLINKHGQWLIPPLYLNALQFSESVASAAESIDKFSQPLNGYINKNNEWVINPKFAEAGKFENGIARVTQLIEDKEHIMPYAVIEGYINIQGNWIIKW